MANTSSERQSKCLCNLQGGRGRRVVLSYSLPMFSLIPRVVALLLPAQPLPIMWLQPHLFQQSEGKGASHPLTHNRSFDTGTLTPCCSSSRHCHSQLSTQLKMCPPRQRPQWEWSFSLATPAHSSRFSSESPSVLISAEIPGLALPWLRCRWFCRFCRMTGEARNSELLNSKICCSSEAKPLETRGHVTSERICQYCYRSYRKHFTSNSPLHVALHL